MMKRKQMDASIFLLGIILALLAGGAAFTVFVLREDPLGEVFSGDRVINSLFILEKDRKPLSSFVLMYYPSTRRAAVFDVPGEVGLIIQRINRVDRIDTVYNPQRVETFVDEVERLLGIEINFHFSITLENLGKIVDLVEGVDVVIPSRVDLPLEKPPLLFPSGRVTLDGEKAVSYASYLLAEEDADIVNARRQRFFLSFLRRLGEQNEYLKIKPVYREFHRLIRGSANARIQTRLFDELTNLDTDQAGVQTVAGTVREVSGQMLILPYYDGSLIKDMVRQSLSGLTRNTDGTLAGRVFTVEILNGTATSGLARRTSDLLQGFGYDVIAVNNADASDYEKTEIIDRSGYEDMVTTFAEIIRCENIRFEAPDTELLDSQNLEYKADFTLIIGKDFNGRYVINQ
ncbi:MAG: LCP family protein [Spirochaetaceae bacterium]|jgi:anionic cell wall polymer biosynthesis LytR-Cps2A-Psr (LCP) family protein|nr:LCP family protein [Spirochaetaceae bacterium]